MTPLVKLLTLNNAKVVCIHTWLFSVSSKLNFYNRFTGEPKLEPKVRRKLRD